MRRFLPSQPAARPGRTPRLRGLAAAGIAIASAVALAACGASGPARAGTATTGTSTDHVSTKTVSDQDPLETLVAKTRSGIVRIQSSTCTEERVGTGFLIGPRLIATVDHVVSGATRINLVQSGRRVATGTVIGEDATRDVALVRSSKPLQGDRLDFASGRPQLGESVAVLGFPLGLPLSVSQGAISGTGRTEPIDRIRRRDLIQTDAALNPGNSGGPLLALDTGRVVGLIDLGDAEAHGISFAVSASVAGPLLSAWTAAPQPSTTPVCATTPTEPIQAATTSEQPTAGPVRSVDTYWADIEAGDYADAWTYLVPGMTSQAAFIQGEQDVTVTDVAFAGTLASVSGNYAHVDVDSLITHDEKYGCRSWRGYYEMVKLDGNWHIDSARITPTVC